MANSTFEQIIHSAQPVLVDFSAEWCGPCKMLAPVLHQVKQQQGEKLRIIKIDVDKNPALSARYQIQGVPTLMLWHHGNLLWRQSGLLSADQLNRAIEKALSGAGVG